MNFEKCWYSLKKELLKTPEGKRFDAHGILVLMTSVEVMEAEKGEKNEITQID